MRNVNRFIDLIVSSILIICHLALHIILSLRGCVPLDAILAGQVKLSLFNIP